MCKMYQVISIMEGVWHHEGFFEDERAAREHRDWLAERMYYCDCEGEVFVNEIDK